MVPFLFGPLEHVALLGASPLFAPLIEWGAGKGLRFTVITSPDQAHSVADLDPVIVGRLEEMERPKRCGLALSFGARWIMKEPIRKALFYDQVVNCHGTRLPFDRGGGNWSYRVMRGDRLGCLLLHQVDDGIDTGPVLALKEYVVPRGCRTPEEIRQDYLSRLLPFVCDFLSQGIGRSAKIARRPMPSHIGSYYPRLLTSEHGHIDWQIDPHELERFVLAFDDPYPGAMANWNGKTVHLKGCQLSAGDARTADWQAGTVIRKGDGFHVVALRDGWTLIVERMTHVDGSPAGVREGDSLIGVPRSKVTATGIYIG